MHLTLRSASCSSVVRFLFTCPRRPTSTLFPYTTLFRSREAARHSESVIETAADKYGREHPGKDKKPRDVLVSLTTFLGGGDRKSTRLNSSHLGSSYAVFCLKKKNNHAAKMRQGTWLQDQ